MMKMIIAIVDDRDTQTVLESLHQEGFTVTKIDSTGGFLRRGNSTMMISAQERDVNHALDIISQTCVPHINPLKKRATIMVLDVEHFEQLS